MLLHVVLLADPLFWDDRFVFVVCTAMSAAGLSALTLGSFMCTLIVICRRFNINPGVSSSQCDPFVCLTEDVDNVAPPIASALGDLLTLFLLSILSTIFLPFLSTLLPLFGSVALLTAAAALAYYTYHNIHVRSLLKQGWTPLIGAMLITSFSGLVLDQFVNRYEGYGLLAIVITGLPGGVGSIFVSRISTLLHATSPSEEYLTAEKLEVEESTPLQPIESDGSGELDFPSVDSTSPLTMHQESHGLSLGHSPSISETLVDGRGRGHGHGLVDREESRSRLFAGTLFAITFPVQILFLLFIHVSGWVELQWTFVFVFMFLFSLSVRPSFSLFFPLSKFLLNLIY